MSIKLSNHYPGHLLVANPNNPRDELSKGVILLCSHNSHLAVGIQINNALTHMTLREVAENIGIDVDNPASRLDRALYHGGVHSVHRVQVIHSTDWRGHTTVQLNKELAITSDISVLNALSRGDGPSKFRATAGYWSWEDGRLDRQLDNTNSDVSHRWEIAPGAADTIFDFNDDEQWRQSLMSAIHHNTTQWL